MKLIDNARQAWRFWSVRLAAAGSTLQALFTWWPDAGLALWNSMPVEVKDLLPREAAMTLPLVFFLAAIVARLIRQPKLENAAAPDRQPAA